MAKRVILLASATTGTSILTSPPPTIHCFLNARNVTALQADCSLTYTGNNIYVSTSFFQALLQGQILAIPDPDAPAGLSPPLTRPSSTGPVNDQQQEMIIQVLLSMGQDRLSKEEASDLQNQRVHTRAASFDAKLCEDSGGLLGRGEPNLFVDWDRVRVTLTALISNMTRPLRGILSLGRILLIVSTNVFRCFYNPATRPP